MLFINNQLYILFDCDFLGFFVQKSLYVALKTITQLAMSLSNYQFLLIFLPNTRKHWRIFLDDSLHGLMYKYLKNIYGVEFLWF